MSPEPRAPRLRARPGQLLVASEEVTDEPGWHSVQQDVLLTLDPNDLDIYLRSPEGTEVIVTPGFWTHYQVWYLNINVRSTRASGTRCSSASRCSS